MTSIQAINIACDVATMCTCIPSCSLPVHSPSCNESNFSKICHSSVLNLLVAFLRCPKGLTQQIKPFTSGFLDAIHPYFHYLACCIYVFQLHEHVLSQFRPSEKQIQDECRCTRNSLGEMPVKSLAEGAGVDRGRLQIAMQFWQL